MSLVLLITMAMSFAGKGCGGQNAPNGPQSEAPTIIATVGSYPVDARLVQARYEKAVPGGATLTAAEEAGAFGYFLGNEIRPGLAYIEAQRKNVPLTDSDIRKDANQSLEHNLDELRTKLMMEGKLKPNSTDKEFSAALKEVSGKSLEDFKKEQMDAIDAELKDPARRVIMAADFAQNEVPRVLATRNKPTDEELKNSFRSLTVKQVLLNGPDVSGQIAKVQADLKSGATFETVVDRYSKDKAPKGKKLSEVEAPVTSTQLVNDAYAPLLRLKAGDVSPVITRNGSVIYKILKVNTDLPKDFEKTKEASRTELATKLAEAQFSRDLEELGRTIAISWKDPGWHALFDVTQALTNPSIRPDEKKAKLMAGIDAAKTVKSQPAALAFYAATEALHKDSIGKPDPSIEDSRIEAIQAVAEFAPGPDLDLELADIYASRKDNANLGQALAAAARDNTDYTPKGQAMYMTVRAKVLKSEALLPADAKKEITDGLAAWRQGNDQRIKDEAETAKAKADADKADAAAKKKFEAQQKAEAAKLKVTKVTTNPPIGPPAPKSTPAAKQ